MRRPEEVHCVVLAKDFPGGSEYDRTACGLFHTPEAKLSVATSFSKITCPTCRERGFAHTPNPTLPKETVCHLLVAEVEGRVPLTAPACPTCLRESALMAADEELIATEKDLNCAILERFLAAEVREPTIGLRGSLRPYVEAGTDSPALNRIGLYVDSAEEPLLIVVWRPALAALHWPGLALGFPWPKEAAQSRHYAQEGDYVFDRAVSRNVSKTDLLSWSDTDRRSVGAFRVGALPVIDEARRHHANVTRAIRERAGMR